MQVNIGLKEETTKSVVEYLLFLWAENFKFYVKAYNFHWNVTGPRFIMLHELFKTVYEAQPDIIDTLAERVRQLGEKVPATMNEIISISGGVKENSEEKDFDENSMIGKLLSDLQTIIRESRSIIEKIKDSSDSSTIDILIKITEDHEKTAWFLRSHLS